MVAAWPGQHNVSWPLDDLKDRDVPGSHHQGVQEDGLVRVVAPALLELFGVALPEVAFQLLPVVLMHNIPHFRLSLNDLVFNK